MLCPEVWNFPEPKTVSSLKKNLELEAVKKCLQSNIFYRSLVIALPDNLCIPNNLSEYLTEDTEYYKVQDCPLTDFTDSEFVNSFVNKGNLHCMCINRDCVIQNCFAITPDGMLTLHVRDFDFQCLGMEGSKQLRSFYQIKLNLKQKLQEKHNKALNKLGNFDFYITWEPHQEDICPSSIAKFFAERGRNVSVASQRITCANPDITEIPSITDVEANDLEEWIGMLALNGELNPTHLYVSSYTQPECQTPIKSTRIAIITVKGFFTSCFVSKLCDMVSEHVINKDSEDYWSSISVQSFTDSLWRHHLGGKLTFQSQDSSTTALFTSEKHTVYYVGQIKYT